MRHCIHDLPDVFLALILRLSELVNLQASCKKLSLLNELMDHSGNYVLSALPFILSLLQRGLGERIYLLAHSLPQDPEVHTLNLPQHATFNDQITN